MAKLVLIISCTYVFSVKLFDDHTIPDCHLYVYCILSDSLMARQFKIISSNYVYLKTCGQDIVYLYLEKSFDGQNFLIDRAFPDYQLYLV
jgi:hypothetical protein